MTKAAASLMGAAFLAIGASILLFATARLVFAWWMAQHYDERRGWRWWGFLVGACPSAAG